MRRRWSVLCGCTLLLVGGCSSLLPSGRQETPTPWQSYGDAEAMFAKIIPNQTRLAGLKDLQIDPATTPNLALLNHADLLRRFATGSALTAEVLDESLRTCLAVRARCSALEIEHVHTDRKRVGNFWLDTFNFRRKVDVTGWRYNILIVLQDDLVVYKLWSGKPNIRDVEEERNPLGPLQGVGDSLLRRAL